MCLDEGQGIQEREWQEPRPSGPKAESWTQALYSAPVLAGAACRHFLELLHFPGLSSTCFISFSRFKDVQWYTTHPENKKFNIWSFFQNIQACSENTAANYQACASWPDGESHVLEARWGKAQSSQHTCVLWLYLHASWACFFFFFFWSLLIKKDQIPGLCLAYCSPHFWSVTGGVVGEMGGWPACVIVLHTKHIYEYSQSCLWIKYKGFIFSRFPAGHSVSSLA